MKLIRRKEARKNLSLKIGAFDIETWGLNATKFAFGVVGWLDTEEREQYQTFFNREEMASFMVSPSFRGYRWYGHNAGGYDMIGLFGNYITDPRFRVSFNGGRFISAVFQGASEKIYFLDSLNLFPSSLNNLGHDLGLSKGETPEKFIIGDTTQPITSDDINYCRQDVRIVLEAVKQFYLFTFSNWQTLPGSTIATTALRIFLRIQKEDIHVSWNDLKFRESYYGGRTELLLAKDREVSGVYYYDFNSLYPSVMVDIEYPEPSSLKHTNHPRPELLDYEGTSEVDIEVPEMFYPPLPLRVDNKLIFPVGRWVGWYNHNELRMAVKAGAKIHRIIKTVYSEHTWNPFKEYVLFMYNKRQEAKKKGHTSESLYYKLLMNSLYGKFAQKILKQETGFIYDNKPGWVFESIRDLNIGVWKKVDSEGKVIEENSRHDIISLASYTTSGARIKLFNAVTSVLKKGGKVFYTDTDSLITDTPMTTSNRLGDLKLEGYGVLVGHAPKIYEWRNISKIEESSGDYFFSTEIPDEPTFILKLKGVTSPGIYKAEYSQTKILKPKEALRRGLIAGEPIEMIKKISGEDHKRLWNESGNSIPLYVNSGEKAALDKMLADMIVWLKKDFRQGVDVFLIPDGFGGYTRGAVSHNAQWFREYYHRFKRYPTEKELRQIAHEFLMEGCTSGEYMPDPDYIELWTKFNKGRNQKYAEDSRTI